MEGQIVVHRTPGDFLAVGEPILTARPLLSAERLEKLRTHLTQGSNRTEIQDVLFLSDQLVEVLTRALSPGVNDPNTAVLCLDWLRCGLSAFALREPSRPANSEGHVLYSRVTFEQMLTRTFANMRQYVAGDRTVTLHAIGVLTDLAIVAAEDFDARCDSRRARPSGHGGSGTAPGLGGPRRGGDGARRSPPAHRDTP